MRTLLTIAIGILLPCSTLARSNSPAEQRGSDDVSDAKLRGVLLSFGAGYGIPFGDERKNNSGTTVPLDRNISGKFPVVCSAGYRLIPLFSVGLAFSYAPMLTQNCPAGRSCSANNMILEGELRAHLASEARFSPWISAQFGYEWLKLSESAAGVNNKATVEGLAFGFLVGGDYRVASDFTIGPFLGVRFGQYDHLSISNSNSLTVSADIPDANQAMHGWFVFGLRGVFTI